MIQVEAITKRYGNTTAVDSLSFQVSAGEILGLVGPNGAGKTTTLRSISGIIPPTSGKITVAGYNLEYEPEKAKRCLAFIPDEPQLFDSLTVEEHLRFIARLYSVTDAQAQSDQLLEELELIDKRQALPGALSRGMKQKLAIACGLLHRPRVLIFDEPLTGLDPAAMRRMRATITARAAAGAAVILSSHLLHLVEELCSTLLVIRQSKLVAHGTIEQILSQRPELEGLSLEGMFLALTGDTESR